MLTRWFIHNVESPGSFDLAKDCRGLGVSAVDGAAPPAPYHVSQVAAPVQDLTLPGCGAKWPKEPPLVAAPSP